MKKIVRLLPGFALAGLFIWLAVRNLSIDEIKSVLANADALLIGCAVVVFFIGYACRIERWRLMLVQENSLLRWRDCAGPLMASVAANNVLPFRAGDLLRAFAFNQRLGVGAPTTLASLFVERLLDLLMIVSFLGLALAAFGLESSRFVSAGAFALIAGGIFIVFLLHFPTFFQPPVSVLCRIVAGLLPKLGEKMLAASHKVFAALAHTARGRVMLKLTIWSVLEWVAEGLVFWLVALSLPSLAYDIAAWLALPAGTLATVIPSTPGYVGTFDYFTAQAMSMLGNSAAASAAFAFLVHAVLWFPVTLVGGLYLLARPIQQQIPKAFANDRSR